MPVPMLNNVGGVVSTVAPIVELNEIRLEIAEPFPARSTTAFGFRSSSTGPELIGASVK